MDDRLRLLSGSAEMLLGVRIPLRVQISTKLIKGNALHILVHKPKFTFCKYQVKDYIALWERTTQLPDLYVVGEEDGSIPMFLA